MDPTNVHLETSGPSAGAAIVAHGLTVRVTVPDKSRELQRRLPLPCFSPKCKRTILDKMDVAFPHGSFTALLGASGAGKTTLLNALCGRCQAGDVDVSGEVLRDPSHTGFTFVVQDDIMPQTLTPREILGYNAELVLPGSHTAQQRTARVEELIDAFYLRNCADTIVGVPGEKRGISGGERKRVSIAMSIVANPQLIFVDEPTSGLDSSAAINVAKILAKLAAEGRTVVCCIHQPSQDIFELFSHVCLLARGKIMYFGPLETISSHFKSLACYQPKHVTTAEWLIDMVDTNREELVVTTPAPSVPAPASSSDSISVVQDYSLPSSSKVTPPVDAAESPSRAKRREHKHHKAANDESPDDRDFEKESAKPPAHTAEFLDYLAGGYQKSDLRRRVMQMVDAKEGLVPSSEIEIAYARTFPMQAAILTKRNLHMLARDKAYIISRLLQTIVIAGLLSALFANQRHNQAGIRNRLGLMFFSCMVQLLNAMISVLFVLPQEFSVFLREYLNGTYRASAYLPAHFIADTPLQVALPILFSAILYWSVGLNTDPQSVGIYVATSILVSHVGSSVGFLISAAARSLSKSLQIAPAIFMPNVMFSGFVLNLSSVTPVLRWVQWVSFLKYSFAALVKNEFRGSNYTDGAFGCDASEIIQGRCPFTSGGQVLEYYGFDGVNIAHYLLALTAFVIVFRLLATAIVTLKMKKFVK